MEKTIEELKLEADALGVSYVKNIGVDRLQAKIDDAKAKLDDGEELPTIAKPVRSEDPKVAVRRKLREMEKENLETAIVKISMVDKRESSNALDYYFGTGDTGMRFPLDVFVEMPKILINLAEEAQSVVHLEVNGNTIHKLQKKFVVEYKR